MIKSVAVLGAGAVGLYYGGKIQQAGHKVQFLSRAGAKISDKVLRVKSITADFSFGIDICGSSSEMVTADLIIVTAKNLPQVSLEDMIRPVIKPSSIILILQNGIGVEESLREVFPGSVILGGLAFTCIQRITPLEVEHLDYGKIVVAPLDAKDSEIALLVANFLRTCEIDCEEAGDLALQRWKKLVWNIPYNPISAITGFDTREIMSNKHLVETALRSMKEVQKVAAAEGCIIEDAFIDNMLESTRNMQPYKTSMLLDKLSGRQIELEAILGIPIQMGKAHGLTLPTMETMYALLQN